MWKIYNSGAFVVRQLLLAPPMDKKLKSLQLLIATDLRLFVDNYHGQTYKKKKKPLLLPYLILTRKFRNWFKRLLLRIFWFDCFFFVFFWFEQTSPSAFYRSSSTLACILDTLMMKNHHRIYRIFMVAVTRNHKRWRFFRFAWHFLCTFVMQRPSQIYI